MNISDLNLVGYMMLTCLSIFWSATALNRKTLIPSLLSVICWIATSIQHMTLFGASTLYPVSYLYFGFALIFTILTIEAAINMFRGR